MQDKYDQRTLELTLQEEAPELVQSEIKPKLGRPRKPDALSDAERARRYRERKKSRREELRNFNKPLSSKIIDLSELPPWKRK